MNYKTPVLFSDILLSICEKVRQSKLRYGFALAVFTFYWVDAPLTVQTCLDCYELFEDLPEEEVKVGASFNINAPIMNSSWVIFMVKT